MNNKKLIILGLLFFVVVSCGAVSQTVNAASPIYVNSGTGSDTYDGTNPTHTTGTTGPKKTIQAAINTVTNGGTIIVAHGVYSEHLTISKSVTINGASKTNTIIDGTTNGRIITITGSNVVNINHLTLRKGKITGNGGAIQSTGDLNVNDCTFTANTADRGGAIYSSGPLTVTHSTFTSNTANQHVGAIFSSGTSTISYSTFTSNTANQHAGAIGNLNSKMTITHSTFTSNSAKDNGGAIFNQGNELKISNSIFKNNHADNNGGAINNFLGATVIRSSHIIGNSFEEIHIDAGSVDAKYNWWGSNANPSGKVNGAVLVSPWLKSPQVVSTYPKKNAKKISRTTIIKIKFSKNIKASTAWKQITVKKKGKKVAIKKKWIKRNILYIQTKKRVKRAYYTVTLPINAIKDTYNINLLKKYAFKFKTR